MFNGIRFVLAGFDPASEAQYRSELVNGGAVDVGRYDSSCTHVIVYGLGQDDPVCVAARSDAKILVTNLWVEDSLETGSLADAGRVLYSPVKDLRGISGAESLYICLTGYQRKERDDIMRMVSLIGAQFSKALIASKVTHLICYKFEGEKYELAKKTRIKLVNHHWLEDCLKAWQILPVERYNRSNWELEVMEAEARDSEEETEMGVSGFSDARSCLLNLCCLGLSKWVKEVPKSPQNSVPEKRSLDTSKDIFSNNKLLSTPDKVAESGRAAIVDEAKINVQEDSGHQSAETQPKTRKDGVLLDTTMVIDTLGEKSSNLMKSYLKNDSIKPSTGTRADVRSPHPHALNGKFYKLSFSRKVSRKNAFSMVSDLSSYLHSSTPAQSEAKVKDFCSHLSLEKAKNKFSSGEIQSTSAAIEMEYYDGNVINLPCDIEQKHVSRKPMDVNNTTKCLGVITAEARKYLVAKAIDTGNMVDSSIQDKIPEEPLRYLKTSKMDDKPDDSDVMTNQLTSYQDSEIRAVSEFQHDWDLSPSKRRKCESVKLQTTTNVNMVESRIGEGLLGKSRINHMSKLYKRKRGKDKGCVFLGKADTSNKLYLCSENRRDPPEVGKAAGSEMNCMSRLASEADVFTKEDKGPPLPSNETENGTVAEALMDARKENKSIVSTCQREDLAKCLNKKGTKPKRMSMQSKEVPTISSSDELQASRVSVTTSSESIWFILSGQHLQKKEFNRVIRHLRGRLCRDSHQWSYQATHLIVPDPMRRTEKFFAAASAGRWILKTDYLTASSQAGRFLAEEPFEWHKSGLSEDGSINLEAPRKWRLLRERTGHGAFHGMQIVIYGECIAPSLETMKRVVKAGGGSILATSPPYNRFLKSRVDFAVISPSTPPVDYWVQEFLQHDIPCILADYLVEYVCKPGYSLDRHVLYNTHASAEKSLTSMSARLEEIIESRTP